MGKGEVFWDGGVWSDLHVHYWRSLIPCTYD